jgi:hypothetical protein
MTRSLRTGLAAGILAVLAVTATLLTVPAATAAAPSPASAAAERAAARPEVGSCHRLTFRAAGAVSDNRRAVSCRRQHTTVTIGVLGLRGRVAWGSDALDVRSSRYCLAKTTRYLRTSQAGLARSAYMYLWFYPTPAQRRAGAKWVRCDLALRGGTASLQNLATRPARTVDSLPYAARHARCLQQRTLTACSYRHQWRAVGTTVLRGRSYPGDAALERRAGNVCPRQTGTRRWYATWPTQTLWKTGARILVCYR